MSTPGEGTPNSMTSTSSATLPRTSLRDMDTRTEQQPRLQRELTPGDARSFTSSQLFDPAPSEDEPDQAELESRGYKGEAQNGGNESFPTAPSQAPEYHITVPDVPQHPVLTGCRSVENYEKLNRISEGSYGVVYRARDRITGDIVALKKLKLDQEKNGFPVTSLREIYTLLLAKHPHIVNVREIVVGDSLTQ